ncbi:MAG: Rrf2 family transcriptional regulator, partial [Gammaproteobacteria bacterium]|nr:Rrf2 family transcriptional regulator [Gammaproteobacteria bacterium]
TVGELAQRYDISRNHLTKVIHYLGQQGYIETSRGKGGGIRLATKPENINIGELVRDTEKNTALAECFNKGSCHCKIQPACRLTGILAEAQQAFYKVLNQYSIADLIVNADALENLLIIRS